jgi:hypothetical protein
MPLYIYHHPDDENKVVEIYQGMNDSHEYIVDGIKWKRIFTKPNAAIDTKVDPYSAKDFVKATNKKGTVGELMDRSKELSEKRKDKEGIDPVKEKIYDDYQKSTGKEHMEKKKDKAKDAVKHIADIEF